MPARKIKSQPAKYKGKVLNAGSESKAIKRLETDIEALRPIHCPKDYCGGDYCPGKYKDDR